MTAPHRSDSPPFRASGRRRPRRLLAAAAAAVAAGLVLSACSTSGTDNAAVVTERVTIPPTADGGGAAGAGTGDGTAQPGGNEPVDDAAATTGGPVVVAPGGDAADPAASSGAPASGAPQPSQPPASQPAGSASSSVAPSSTKPTEPPKLPTELTVTPKNNAVNIKPLDKISVSAKGGTIKNVEVLNPEGKVVYGGKVNKASWSVEPELGYGRKYVVKVTSRSTTGVEKTTQSSFTTIKPGTIGVSIYPSAGRTYGIAMPVVMKFSKPVPDSDRRALEKMITVKSSPSQPGAFRWFSQTELHWRPKDYWKPGTKVNVGVNIYGKRVIPGTYGDRDMTTSFDIGRDMQTVVDAKSFRFKVYKDGKLQKDIPVSLGNDKYPTANGVHVVSEFYDQYRMDSSTWGLTGAGAYITDVKWATRISYSGEFVHGAPWSEFAQGKQNVSHGCINMTDANAKWFQDVSIAGDPVKVINSKGGTLDWGDGLSDWTIPWDKY
ncbi:L,D-transpeptidase [Nakamurella aerolata]|uniref:L,D-transpeptidase family protein n=1 Tax=Nakamurella aerolata TaxID=1656892 RepID=A0A849A9K1_9ACTN|nr:Ig-like domain-containing protein [Nakamurella aerolata]NNG35778.1 L,D-transpeptidase family protein [Nakamurella aerolata]